MNDEFSYDRLPYPSKFFVQTFPGRLATQALLFGMESAAAETSTVLELGCGNGSNLIAQAYLMPQARFTGIDLSKVHIDEAKAATAELGLGNVEFHQADVMEMSAATFGRFDYIVAHGLFSWVPEAVRTRVLELFRELLNPNGVGYISYSAFPGAHERQITQHAMRFASRGIEDPAEKVERALGFLKFAAEQSSNRGTYGQILVREFRRHGTRDLADVFHDDLAELNTPFYFHEFAELLAANGLQFLAEAELHAMGTADMTPAARDFISGIDDVIEREQYLDIFRGRAFRQSLVVRSEVNLDRDMKPNVLDRLLVSSSLRPAGSSPDLVGNGRVKFAGNSGQQIEIDLPLAKTALARLSSLWPRAVALKELVGEARERAAGLSDDEAKQQAEAFRQMLFQIATATDLVELHTFQPSAAAELLEKPKLSRLARWQMASARNVISGFGIDMEIADPVSRRLLELLDGKRSRSSVLDELGKFIRSSHEIEGKKELLATLAEWLDESLAHLARLGMYEG
ncbi:MAG: class I SAM-dependent methyltransferase [Acidobacteria bacterium]|nr:class I SAM-dependent methyltransferase [Acidobacteriota bacterium]